MITHHEYRGYVFTITYQRKIPPIQSISPTSRILLPAAARWPKPLPTPVNRLTCMWRACKN